MPYWDIRHSVQYRAFLKDPRIYVLKGKIFSFPRTFDTNVHCTQELMRPIEFRQCAKLNGEALSLKPPTVVIIRFLSVYPFKNLDPET